MKYIYNCTDKLGRKRYRFRRKGFPGVELPPGRTVRRCLMRSKETKMLKTLTAAALALTMLVAPACAETYNYACKVSGVEPNPNNTYLYSAKIDTTKNTITWRGTVYKNAKRTFKVDGEECAKWCFGNNKIMLSTATQGVATLSVTLGTGRPGDDGAPEEFDCDLVR